MARKPTGGKPGRPPTVRSTQELVLQRELDILGAVRAVMAQQKLPAPPEEGAEPQAIQAWLEEISSHLGVTVGLKYKLAVAELAATDPAMFLKVMAKNADLFMPKLGKIDQNVKGKLEGSVFVRVSERDEPIGMEQQPDGSWAPIFAPPTEVMDG